MLRKNEMRCREDGYYVVDASARMPERLKEITGFVIRYRLLEGGCIGQKEMGFPVNAVMVAKGACRSDQFGWDMKGSFPTFIGPAEEIITHVTGANSYVGTMLFTNGTDSGPLADGEEAEIRFEGHSALFHGENTCVTVAEMYDTHIELQEISWLCDEITEEEIPFAWESVEKIEYPDVPTMDAPGSFNYVDITIPAGEGPFPVILWIHGGGWTQMNRKSCIINRTIDYLMACGFAVASAEYTLTVQDEKGQFVSGGWPQAIYDLKTAVRFLRANAAKYRLDTECIIAMGESAGAHLSQMMGTTNGKTAYEDLSMGCADFSSDVQLVVSYFGVSDCKEDPIMGLTVWGREPSPEEADAVSPLAQVDGKTVPMYLTHGLRDTTVRPIHTEKMEAALKEAIGEENVTAVYYPEGVHANRKTFDSPRSIQDVSAFVLERAGRILGRELRAPANTAL